ncbi:L,D-transpeptidase family protein [Stutzerimonas kirkiae]|uniref:L,D-transpeptidase family protein n=1 Tax=Stutzerimonas kirkiae TaxID=2211392 RepID=UPI001F61C67E|nr:L,D-transpeptidase family protein [Stutzerimonas kirkiae]
MYRKRVFGLFSWLLASALAVADEPSTSPSAPAPVLQALAGYCRMPASFDAPARERLQAFYGLNAWQPLWQPLTFDELLEQLQLLADDGLNPALYGTDALRQRLQTPPDEPLARECSDLLASHAYLLALQHLRFGQLQQSQHEPLWRSQQPLPATDQQRLLEIAAIGLARPEQAFDLARPMLEQYRNLRMAHAHLAAGAQVEWPSLPVGPTLRPDMTDGRVPVLRERLLAEGYLAAEGADEAYGELYTPALVTGVRAFQRAHGLQDDGLVGVGTLAELNASAQQRLGQVRINLERFRWFARDIEAQSLLVDITGGQLVFLRDYRPLWRTRTQVGKAARQTPAMKSVINRLTLNPTWTVPPTILREDKLPKIRRDPGYLDKHRMRVIDHQGNPLDPNTIDWSRPGGIMLRQAAGPENPLGRVAIRFPNPFSVYLHDTPSQYLFGRTPRAFSSGCVRVEGAMQLIDLLLSEDERARVTELLGRGETYEFRLSGRTPILMAYWTAEADGDGHVFFRPDIYGQDARLLKALDTAQRTAP